MLAVAFLYNSSNVWFKTLPHVIASNITKSNFVKVYSQSEMPNIKWHRDHNHDYDPVSLQLIRIANKTLDFEWLIVSDGDTCFDISKLKVKLKRMNASKPLLLGHPMSPKWRCCCTGSDCCLFANRHNLCNPTKFRSNFYDLGYSRPNIWPFGGAGYIISRALLNSMRLEDWQKCETKIRRNGGDVRVSSCIFSLTGIGLTHFPSMFGHISHHRSYEC